MCLGLAYTSAGMLVDAFFVLVPAMIIAVVIIVDVALNNGRWSSGFRHR